MINLCCEHCPSCSPATLSRVADRLQVSPTHDVRSTTIMILESRAAVSCIHGMCPHARASPRQEPVASAAAVPEWAMMQISLTWDHEVMMLAYTLEFFCCSACALLDAGNNGAAAARGRGGAECRQIHGGHHRRGEKVRGCLLNCLSVARSSVRGVRMAVSSFGRALMSVPQLTVATGG